MAGGLDEAVSTYGPVPAHKYENVCMWLIWVKDSVPGFQPSPFDVGVTVMLHSLGNSPWRRQTPDIGHETRTITAVGTQMATNGLYIGTVGTLDGTRDSSAARHAT